MGGACAGGTKCLFIDRECASLSKKEKHFETTQLLHIKEARRFERIANTRRLEFQIFFLILDGEDFLVKLIVDRIVAKPRGRKGNKVSYSQELSGSRFTVLSFFVALGPSRSLPQQIVKSETIEKVFIEPGALGRRIFSFDNKV